MNKFIKCTGTLLLAACIGTASYGKAVDENTAKTIGCNFLISTYGTLVSNPADLTTAYIATAQGAYGIITDYYVFNVQGKIGFVMVSGDDNIQPILACSNESSFNIDQIAPNAKFWIQLYQDQITYSVSHNLPAQAGVPKMWADLVVAKKSVMSEAKTTSLFPSNTAHLVTTKWDQEPGYNTYCPSGTPTGCVATSTAQVMNFWKWPTVGCGYHTYKSNTLGSTLSANFSNTAYNWTKMATSPNASNTAIDTLMFHVGVAVNMDYTTSASGSGAYTTQAESPIVNCSEYALKTYFHYKRTLHGVERNEGYADSVGTAAWNSILIAEMNAGRPVLYSGQGSGGGHAWVCDGYNSSNLFHMNWGWNGTGPDAWYSVNYLAPPAVGAGGGSGGFDGSQAIIVGIQPDSFPTTTSSSGNIQLAAHLNCGLTPVLNTPASYVVSSVSITTQVANTASAAFSGDLCAQIFDTSMVYITTLDTKSAQTIAAAGNTGSITFASTSSLYQLVPGYYNVRIMYRPTGTTTWTPVANSGSFINDNMITIGNSQAIELYSNISPINGTKLIKNQPLTVTSSLVNASTSSFNGGVRAVFVNVVTGALTAYGSSTTMTLFGGFNAPFSTASTVTVPGGTYTLAIQHQVSGSWIYTGSDIYENPVIVTVVGGTAINTPSLDDRISVFPNPAKDVINVKMDDVTVDKITVTSILGRLQQEVTPSANQSSLTIPVGNLAAGIYFVNLYSGSEVVTKKIVIAK